MSMTTNQNAEESFCSLLDQGIAWFEQTERRLKERAAEIEAQSEQISAQLRTLDVREATLLERERRVEKLDGELQERSRSLGEREESLRRLEESEREQCREVRQRTEARLRELSDLESHIRDRDDELSTRRRRIEVCEAAIFRFQQTIERISSAGNGGAPPTQSATPQAASMGTASMPAAGLTAPAEWNELLNIPR
ncbi:MAG: hypothetical protein HZB38_09385 [Planctomycetes bacterium]|nr:hypothetical protein [Planctomycetota bacterium]